MGPEAISGIYATDVVSGFDIYKPEIHNTLFRRYGDQGASFFQLLRSMGFERPAKNDTYGHFEDNWVHCTFHSRGIVAAGAAGAQALITLDLTDLDANNRFYPRLWDTVLFPNEVQASITAIDVTVPTAPVLTVKPSDILDSIPALTAGEELVINSDAWSEGSGQPTGALSSTWEYSNTAQIIKETIGYTGTEMVTQTWFDVRSDGVSIPAYYFLGQLEIDYRMALKIDGALLWGKQTTNTIIDPDTGRPIKTTEGLIPYIRRVGNEQTYTANAFSVDEFDEMDNTLQANFVGNNVLALLGSKLFQEIENGLVTYFADSNIQYARQTTNDAIFNSDESLGASVNFKYLTKSERTFMFKRMGNFSNPKTYGAEGYDAKNMGLFLPVDRKKDPVSNDMVPSIGVRYRALGPYSRRMQVWKVGGTGPGLMVTEFDKENTYQRCHLGFEGLGGNRMVLMETA